MGTVMVETAGEEDPIELDYKHFMLNGIYKIE